MDPRTLEKYRRRLFRRWPLVGGWLQRRAARALAAADSPAAVQALAEALLHSTDPPGQALAHATLARLDSQAAVDGIAFAWAVSRHPDLQTLLLQRGVLPSGPPEVRLLAALKLGRPEPAQGVGGETVTALLQACRDADADIAARAGVAVRLLTDSAAVQALCAEWVRTRDQSIEQIVVEAGYVAPQLPARLLTALKVGRRDQVLDLGPGAVPDLVAALEDRDPAISAEAQALAVELPGPETRAALAGPLCLRWAQTRSPTLEAVVVGGRLVPAEPLPVRVLAALKTGQGELLREEEGAVVEPLLAACADRDPAIAAGAGQALRALQDPEAREAVCRLFLDRDDRHARDAALEAGYLPRDEHRRALFLFLNEQWERYEALDFDRRLLFAVLEAADAGLRQRIVEKLRVAGRTDFLTVLAGSDYRSRAARMTPAEADFLVQMLAANAEWDKLWGLAFELPLRSSVRIIRTLAGQDWRPPRDDERATFARLAELAAGAGLGEESLGQQLPPAALRARARVSGRVNDVAFSPSRPLIAIGTGRRVLVLWDFGKGERAGHDRKGFNHSIGKVAFTHDDTLLCSERGRDTKPPGGQKRRTLHGWRGGERFAVPHKGEVTALEPVCGAEVLVAFRDRRVARLDAAGERNFQEHRVPFECGAARAAPGGTRAALLHKGVTLVGWPGLDPLAASARQDVRNVVTCAAFAGADGTLVLGKHNGEVVVCRQEQGVLRPEAGVLTRHRARVQAVEVVGNGSVVLSAGADGELIFTSWANRAVVGRVRSEGSRLTSLHLTPGGDFMAVGDSDASMSLWDLRVLEIPLLLSNPFARALPVHLAAVNALAGDGALPPLVARALLFVRSVLQHRFRYDVEVDEVPAIRTGDFDIEIEG